MKLTRISLRLILLLLLPYFTSAEPPCPAPSSVRGRDVLALVEELAGPAYEGRMIGSAGGLLAARRLEGLLRTAGFGVEFQEFPERIGVLRGEARLEIRLPGGAPEAFEYRRDFRETVRGGWVGGQATGPLRVLETKQEEFPRGSVLLVPAASYDPENLDEYASRGAVGVILELPEGSPAQRTGYTGSPPGRLVEPRKGPVVLAVSKSAFRRLETAARGGAAVRMASPVRFEDVTGRNLIAVWNGDGGGVKPRLVLMAHYDHMGMDLDGRAFGGALDNASGAALVVRLAEALAGRNLSADFAVVLTDGEEINLSGSWTLANRPPFPLKGAAVLNLDMVGSGSDLPVSVFYNGDPASRGLADATAAALASAGFRPSLQAYVHNLDHAHLPRAGARAVSVCEYDTAVYHTKGDLPSLLSETELSALGEAFLRLALEELSIY